MLGRELPAVLVSHWPGMYFNGEEVGFQVLQEVKRRLDRYDPDGSKTRWMKFSEIGHYWMARGLSDISVTDSEQGSAVQIETHFPTADFTLAVDQPLQRVQVNGMDLRPVYSQVALAQDTFWVDGARTVFAFALADGTTAIQLDRA